MASPYWANHTNPPGLHLIFPDNHKSRTCIYISKHLRVDRWRKEHTLEGAEWDITSINLQTNLGKLSIHNVYNLPSFSHSSRDLRTIKFILDLLTNEGHHILVGDFNLHHLRWGGPAVCSHQNIAETLMNMLAEKDKELTLPGGKIIWSNRGIQSTVDLVFVSRTLEDSHLNSWSQKLAKWARKNAEERRKLPQIPDIQDNDGTIHTDDADKATAVAWNFFPQPASANIRDIKDATYLTEFKNVSSIITDAEVEEAVDKLPNGKAPGPDKVPNRALRQCKKSLSKHLAVLFNACLSKGYYPRKFKESIIFVLRKPQKPSYSTPKAYRPIALLNTMGKLLEKLVANCWN